MNDIEPQTDNNVVLTILKTCLVYLKDKMPIVIISGVIALSVFTFRDHLDKFFHKDSNSAGISVVTDVDAKYRRGNRSEREGGNRSHVSCKKEYELVGCSCQQGHESGTICVSEISKDDQWCIARGVSTRTNVQADRVRALATCLRTKEKNLWDSTN